MYVFKFSRTEKHFIFQFCNNTVIFQKLHTVILLLCSLRSTPTLQKNEKMWLKLWCSLNNLTILLTEERIQIAHVKYMPGETQSLFLLSTIINILCTSKKQYFYSCMTFLHNYFTSLATISLIFLFQPLENGIIDILLQPWADVIAHKCLAWFNNQ